MQDSISRSVQGAHRDHRLQLSLVDLAAWCRWQALLCRALVCGRQTLCWALATASGSKSGCELFGKKRQQSLVREMGCPLIQLHHALDVFSRQARWSEEEKQSSGGQWIQLSKLSRLEAKRPAAPVEVAISTYALRPRRRAIRWWSMKLGDAARVGDKQQLDAADARRELGGRLFSS